VDAEKYNNYRGPCSENKEINSKNQFFAKFNGVIANVGNTRELFMLGDFNGRTRREINNKIWNRMERNDNGTRLIDICKCTNLTIKNEFFEHKQIHNYIWTQANRNFKINN